MRMQVILDSSFACPGSAPIRGGKKGEFRDWTNRGIKDMQTYTEVYNERQGYLGVHRGIQGYTGVCRGKKGYTEVYLTTIHRSGGG